MYNNDKDMIAMKLVFTLYHASIQIKYFHLHTKKYSTHEALGSLYKAIDKIGDRLSEVLYGHFGVANKPFGFSFDKYGSKQYCCKEYVVKFTKELDYYKEQFSSKSDIVSLLDEIDAEANLCLYLLNME